MNKMISLLASTALLTFTQAGYSDQSNEQTKAVAPIPQQEAAAQDPLRSKK